MRAAGNLLPGEIHVYTAGPGGKVGYRVVAPLSLADGRRILLDRGFVPIGQKDAPRPPGPVAVVGNLVWPDDGPADPDRAKNIWIARDVPLMAAALGTAPILVVASEASRRAARCRCRSAWRSRTTISAMRSPGSASPRSGR